MEKVILITSRKISDQKVSSEFEEIKYGPIPVVYDTDMGYSEDANGYFWQFLTWVTHENDKTLYFRNTINSKDLPDVKKSNNCKKLVSDLLKANDPKEEDRPFKLGIFKRKIDPDGPTIYLAEEFPCKGDKKKLFAEDKQRYLNSIIMEIRNDMSPVTEFEWLVLSHDNDWGKEGSLCLKKKGKNSSVSVESIYSELAAIVNNTDKAEIWAFRHVPEDDTYQFAKSLMKGENYDFEMYSEMVARQRKVFADFLDCINDLENIDMDAFRDLEIDPNIPFLPYI